MNTILVVSIFCALLAALFLIMLFLLLKTLNSMKAQPTIPKELSDLYANIGSVKKALDGLDIDQKALTKGLFEAQRTLDNIKTDYDARKKVDEMTRESIKRLENIIAGSKAKGMAGENVLREIFKLLPQDMIVSGFRVRGKEVEFGMLLANKKVVPIDSKWVATDLLASLAAEEDESKKETIAQAVEREVTRRISEVAQYIDTTVTSSLAIAAVPDAAYTICRNAHASAYRRGVVLIPYSMVLPYLLIFFNLHLQFASSIDIENLQHYLLDVKRSLDLMEDVLENKIMRAKAMIENAAGDYRLNLSSIRSSIKQIESSQRSVPAPQDPAVIVEKSFT